MSFKSQKEIYEALLAGKKLRRDYWDLGHFVHLSQDGSLVNRNGINDSWFFKTPKDWSIYEEPKKKKKITLYRYTYKQGENITETPYTTNKYGDYFLSNISSLIKTESKEIEIEVDE